MSQKSSKKYLFVLGPLILVIALIGITYAFFNYTKTGASNTIRVGRISFVSKNEETITLNNLFPIDPSNTTDMNDSTKVGTYSIDIEGDTDYSDGIEYLVSVVDANIYTNTGQAMPISLDITTEGLGTSNASYFTVRENTNANIYKKLVGDTLVGDQMLLVGYIKPNTTNGTAEGIDGSITIKAYLDENNIVISDTYDGTESDNMGTTNNWAEGKTVLTTLEWNAIQSSGVSFKVKVEANEGIWIVGSLEEIMKNNNIGIDTENGVDFSKSAEQDNTSGIYTRAGTENDTYPIMYYRGGIEDNNVLFNNKCWKAVRTTDTGGVKLIYNGEVGAVYDKIPLTESQYTLPSGATNNFTFNQEDNSWNITITDNAAKEISFKVPAGDGYTLVQTGTSGSTTGGMWELYKDGTSIDSFGNGGGAQMNDMHLLGTLTASNVIKWKYTGSSSVQSPITFKLQMLHSGDLIAENGCDNIGESTYISVDLNGTPKNKFAFNTNSNSPAYVGYMYGDVYTYNSGAATSGAYYGSSFTYDGTNYTLVDPVTTKNNTHHYTCNLITAEGTCTTIRYYYYGNYYVNLTGGDSIERAMEKMQTNTNDSNAKDKIDTWYASNMNTVTSKLEDTIWCNDRSMGNGNNNGWIANGGDLSTKLYYGAYQRSASASNTSTVKNQPSLACADKNDRFTWKNSIGNRNLDYPVGLLTSDEMTLTGELFAVTNATSYLSKGSKFWTFSPQYFNEYYALESLFMSHFLHVENVSYPYAGLRPAISIKPSQLITKGTGTVVDPYIIK